MKNVKKAMRLKSELDDYRPLSKEDELRVMQKFQLDWNYHSNHIEGNSLTYGETKALILFGITAEGKPLRDHFEIDGHNDAIKWVMDIVKQDRPLTENFIRELHKLILKEPYEVDAITPDGKYTTKKIEIGKYKSIPNHVKTKTGEIFRFASPEETPALMKDLLEWYRNETKKIDFNPIIVAVMFHYKFIRTHPFDDGNGRTVRILMNFVLMKYGFPPVIIKTEDKVNYFNALQQADIGRFEPFIEYIAENLVTSLEIMIKGAKGESIDDLDDIDKEIALLKQKLDTIEKPVTIIKSADVIKNVFDTSVMLLFDSFITKAKKFETFYVTNTFHFWVDTNYEKIASIQSLSRVKENIKNETYLIKGTFSYVDFRYDKSQKSAHDSSIEFHFDTTSYTVTDSKKQLQFVKLYKESLTDEEVLALVKTEVIEHKKQIEKRIQ